MLGVDFSGGGGGGGELRGESQNTELILKTLFQDLCSSGKKGCFHSTIFYIYVRNS